MELLNLRFETGRELLPTTDHQSSTPVVTIGPLKVILVDCGSGRDLQRYLASHGIVANWYPGEEGPIERLEIAQRVSADVIQTIVDDFPRHRGESGEHLRR